MSAKRLSIDINRKRAWQIIKPAAKDAGIHKR